jgi:hypothetical protein
MFIPLFKFSPRKNSPPTRITDSVTGRVYDVKGFQIANDPNPANITSPKIPFPSEDTFLYTSRYVPLPYVAFNYLGQLEFQTGVSPEDEFIPLARGSVLEPRDANKNPYQGPPDILEKPPGNGTNAYNLIHIDWLTGRARLERQEISGL